MELVFCFLVSWFLVMRDAAVDGLALIRGEEPPRHAERMARITNKHAVELARIKAGNPTLAQALARRMDQRTREREARAAHPTTFGPFQQFASAVWEDAWMRATDRWYDRRDRTQRGELPRQRAWRWLMDQWNRRRNPDETDEEPITGKSESTAPPPPDDRTDPKEKPEERREEHRPDNDAPHKCCWVFRESGTLCSADGTHAWGAFLYCSEHISAVQAEEEANRRSHFDKRQSPIYAEATRLDQPEDPEPEAAGDPAPEGGNTVSEIFDPQSAYEDAMKLQNGFSVLMEMLDARIGDLHRLAIEGEPLDAYESMKDGMAFAMGKAQDAAQVFLAQLNAKDHLDATPGGGSGEYYGRPESGAPSGAAELVGS